MDEQNVETTKEILDTREREAQYRIKRDYGHFVIIDYRSSDSKIKTAMGILEGLTPSNLLSVVGDKNQKWDIDPLMITSFYGRPRRR